MHRFSLIAAVVAIMISFAGCTSDSPEPVHPPKHIGSGQPQFEKEGTLNFLKPDGSVVSTIDIEIADTPDQQQRGLMNRSFMQNDQGMLFIFDEERPQSFWMKNTIIPLDIIYVNSKMNIVSIAENTTPYSEQSIPSRGPAIYVVEVNGGYAAQFGLQAGYQIQYTKK